MKGTSGISRRGFVKQAAVCATAAAWCGKAFAAPRLKPRGERLNLGVIGTGGQGRNNWRDMLGGGSVHVQAFCDVDATKLDEAKEWYVQQQRTPDFRTYSDYRQMLEKEKGLDVVVVSTPDHTHARAAIMAMRQGCHVYVEKPLVRTIWEARYFGKVARECGVFTQMGNSCSPMEGLRRGAEILRSGVLGNIGAVYAWVDRPEISPGNKWGWKQPVPRPEGADPVPQELNWDVWLGTAPERPFKKDVYHQIAWRAFHDFGTGALGDMGCHTLNLAFRGLELGAVVSAEAVDVSERVEGSFPRFSVVRLDFAARGDRPPVSVYWHDGYKKPSAELMPQVVATMGGVPGCGCLFIGDKGILFSAGTNGDINYIALAGEPKLRSIDKHEACLNIPKSLPRVNCGHRQEFINACRGEGKPFSDIDHSVPFVESVLLGSLAQRVPGKIKWDASECMSDNALVNTLIKPHIRAGWEF